jgi:hypothetical protein
MVRPDARHRHTPCCVGAALVAAGVLGCHDPVGLPPQTSSAGNHACGESPCEPHAEGDGGSGQAAAPVDTPWRVQNGDGVFFVGNSFFGGDHDRLADLVVRLGGAVHPPITMRTGSHVVYGNRPLAWFFEQPESQEAIRSGDYRVFILQGEEREPVDKEDAFRQAVHDYHEAVTAHGGRLMLFMTWDFIWESESNFFQRLSSTYDALGRELGIPVIPVGLIYDDCNQNPWGGEAPYWLTSQGLHQNAMGTAVNTYATFAMLTGVNPVGAPFTEPEANTMPPELLRYLSDASWARVAPRLQADW